jgi:broad specificity phosphatase PhoE
VRLLLIRHGQTPANVTGAVSSAAPGPGLTDLGHEQAEALATALADVPLDGLYVSTLRRTSLTAAPLAKAQGLDAEIIDGIHEIEAGDSEGSTDPDVMLAYMAPIRRWQQGDWSATIPGAHDGNHFLDRFDRAVATVFERHGDESTVALVSHAGAIRIWLGGRTPYLGPDFSSTHRINNTGVVVVVGSPTTGWAIESWQGEPIGGEVFEDPSAQDPLAAPDPA